MARIRNDYYSKSSIKQAVKDKMRVLSDFYICDQYDKDMEAKLYAEIEKKPDKDPREVLDYFCKPMIQEVVNRWV